ncbi:phosphoglycerate dehydrogenase [Labrys miyagiensis]|uniref:Phosphoglycerate dehydrogenase n=1 Tax=Labrys miyagiensis TaxID=346912 RepID=A0ABQ6C9U9_9HYPH|nr:NAD(P)-dependent oxidoreductase [Labrys miyagiensis]GLS17148.1 phosphoglycerate dehydrogenase [Labrys miyagiensis]
MANAETLKAQREQALELTRSGPPARTSNPFFGVGPITDGTLDEADARLLRFEFDNWLEQNYRKLDDRGADLGPFTTAEVGRSMHRGYPADKFLLDMMREIHRYFEFPKANKMAVGLGGGHSGFTVCALHLVTARDPAQHVYVDTLRPESEAAKAGGFFRQSWGAQLIEMHRYAHQGDESRIHFAEEEGAIPSADTLEKMGVKLFIGVGHETTGATTYTAEDIANLLEWLDRNPAEHHAVLDATSMLGAMPWGTEAVNNVIAKCCMFMPFQKAIGGISGYFVVSFTPQALGLVEKNQKSPSWAIPRQLKIVAPVDPKRPLTGERTVNVGPIYDPAQDKMLGGVINTYSTLAFAETTFGLLRSEKRLGSVSDLYQRSVRNRAAVNDWVAKHPLFELGVVDPERRGAAVTLLRIKDADITDPAIHARIIARSKQVLAYEGVTHPNGEHERGLDVARYVNAFPGTPGDYRAWIGGIRPAEDIDALLDNLQYAYLRAKIVVLEEELAKLGETFAVSNSAGGERVRRDDPGRAYKVLVADLVGMRFNGDGEPDHQEVRRHIEAKGGVFHLGPIADEAALAKGRIHFFYQPDLSTEAEILPQTDKGQYDAVIAAATFLPKNSVFPLGGVRIGAGTGNMGSASWGGGSGAGGEAPLMNTPSFNSRATAQMAFKALLKVAPDLKVDELHRRVVAGEFDTGKHLRDFPTEKLEGRRIAVIGYGNIGRELAKLASAFGMKVAIHARERHKDWIESEGFEYAATAEAAAEGAHILTVHTGLGPVDAKSGRFANQSLVNTDILNRLADGAVLINYDRGEVVDAEALDAALTTGRVSYACIDADLFRNASDGTLSGPMVPYRALESRHPGKLELLPHAAADTDHPSRVEGAMQAVDQIFDVIHYGVVTNLKGDLPAGYVDAGARTVNGIGAATRGTLARAVADETALREAREAVEALAAIWGALSSTTDPDRRATLMQRHGAALVRHTNRYAALTERLGLRGPYAG